jgi:hypothetical protein
VLCFSLPRSRSASSRLCACSSSRSIWRWVSSVAPVQLSCRCWLQIEVILQSAVNASLEPMGGSHAACFNLQQCVLKLIA